MLTGFEEAQAILAAEKALAKALATSESVAQRESYHKEGKLVLLTQAEISHLLYAIKESQPEKWLNDQGLVIIGQLVEKLQKIS